MVKPVSAGDAGSVSGSRKSPEGRKWQLTPVFLPGKSHRQRCIGGYSSWGCKELGMTKGLSMHVSHTSLMKIDAKIFNKVLSI